MATLDLNLKLVSIHVYNTDEKDSEWNLDIDVGKKFYDWTNDSVKANSNHVINHDFVFNNYDTDFDLDVFYGGFEKDESASKNDALPSSSFTLNAGDFYDHSFTTPGENSEFSYTLKWDLNVS